MPKAKEVTYDREHQCDLMPYDLEIGKRGGVQPSQNNAGTSNEEDMPNYQKQHLQTGIVAAGAPSPLQQEDLAKVEEDKAECLIMSKEDSKVIVRTKEFESFMDKTSKMIERALTGSEDILGPSLFLEGLSETLEGEESSNNNLNGIGTNNRDKLVSMFTFMDEKQTNRTVTSL